MAICRIVNQVDIVGPAGANHEGRAGRYEAWGLLPETNLAVLRQAQVILVFELGAGVVRVDRLLVGQDNTECRLYAGKAKKSSASNGRFVYEIEGTEGWIYRLFT